MISLLLIVCLVSIISTESSPYASRALVKRSHTIYCCCRITYPSWPEGLPKPECKPPTSDNTCPSEYPQPADSRHGEWLKQFCNLWMSWS
ncbi:hypothetical protein KIN20_020624 [Parelaphostrongylus tenuis]|uniref:Secreted protein n=1 Tax=Parelaphostrongylus tenuis TaxID=148309 RepID=A0AAD5QTV9_PARTN|nr:hypothetical protein KIN20_020624 [Parelaphostrongylus tenuis]